MKYIFTPLFIFSLLFTVSFPNEAAFAQKKQTPVTDEDVAIAFYRTGDIQPSFADWAKNTKRYKATPLARREAVMEEEVMRIKSLYFNYIPSRDYLFIQTSANVRPYVVSEQGSENETYHLEINFSQDEDAFFFPYQYQENNFAVLPMNLDDMLNVEISKGLYEELEGKTRGFTSYPFTILMRPKEALTDRPLEYNGVPQWILKTEIASAEIWSRRGALMWEYTAPWYISPNVETLNKLYELKPDTAQNYGTIKALDF
ncbi:MAG: hypothetical protein AAF549_00220 [Pseudomonadota bacterium]